MESNQDGEQVSAVEPRFKYERLLQDVSQRLEKDTASTVAIHDRFLAIGFSSGLVRLFDHFGNEHFNNTFRKHKCSVTQIAFDGPGNYIISCANDSTVCIQGIGHSELNQVLRVVPAAKTVALAADFSNRGSKHRFVGGGQGLVLYERGFLGKYKAVVLFQGLDRDGLVTMCSWKGSLIAFTNDTGTRLYDCALKRMISLVQPVHNVEAFFSSRFLPHHCWIDALTLAISWGSTISICHITSQTKDTSGIPSKKVEILHQWSVPDFYIAGISYTPSDQGAVSTRTWDELVLFGLVVDVDESANESATFDDSVSVISDVSNVTALATLASKQTSAQLMMLKPVDLTGYTVTTEDSLLMKHSDLRFLNKFAMAALPYDSLYFLLGTREVIEARPCSLDDRVKWFLENQMFEEALECARKDKPALVEVSFSEVGRKLVHSLTAQGKFTKAASMLPQICGRDKEEWEYYVNEFDKFGEILKIIPFVPLGSPQLEPECYEAILTAALYSRTSLFRKLVCEWSADLYRSASIIDKALRRLTDSQTVVGDALSQNKKDLINIYQSLAHLFAYVRNFDRALSIYLLLKDKTVFGVIDKYHLFPMVRDRIVELMDINADLAIRLLLDNEDLIPVNQVVTQLSRHPKLQMAYLNRLFTRGEGSEYVDLMVRLFVEYDRPKLLPFLKKAENYRLDLALDLSRRKHFVEEMVFLLGRSGNKVEALEVLVKESNDIDKAIEFCTEHEDDLELWDRLIDLSVTNPLYISKVLLMAGVFVDPLTVLEKMPTSMEVPGLKAIVTKVILDYQHRLDVLRHSEDILNSDHFRLFERKAQSNVVGVGIGSDRRCDGCGELICRPNSGDIVLLGCEHVFHQSCLRADKSLCPNCSFQFSAVGSSSPESSFPANPFGEF